jgi:hypothetical protein
LKEHLPKELVENKEYFENVILPALTFMFSTNDDLIFPDISRGFTKQDAVPRFMWGVIWDDWARQPDDGTSIFLQGYENRGDANRKKAAYFSALTPDLYPTKYAPKVDFFISNLLSESNEQKPFMGLYTENYLNLYWNLHLDVKPEEIPDYAKGVGSAFITCLALVFPINPDDHGKMKEYKTNYMYVRENRAKLNDWVGKHFRNIKANPQDFTNTFVHYWIENSGEGAGGYEEKDIVFECFHNYLALSQWGNAFYNMVNLLREDNQDAEAQVIQTYFKEMMNGDYSAKASKSDSNAFSKIDFFIAELMRVIMPNTGSISRMQQEQDGVGGKIDQTIIYDHVAIGNSPLHWADAVSTTKDGVTTWKAPFNPERYADVPGSNEIDEEGLMRMAALARCPYDHGTIETADGRTVKSNPFGTMHSSTGDVDYPVIESAGFSPFGFGYRRCAGELFTIEVIKAFLVHVWDNNICFKTLDIAEPTNIPVAPATYIADSIGFYRSTDDSS